MSKIGFLTDSCSDIPQELADKYGIEVVGFPINLDGVEYMERKDFTNDQFYQMMRDAQGVPTTAAITQLQWCEIYERYVDEGYTDLVHLCINSAGSSTYNNAVKGAEMLAEERPGHKLNIQLIDSHTYSMPYGWYLCECARKVRNGGELATCVEEMKQRGYRPADAIARSGELQRLLEFMERQDSPESFWMLANHLRTVDQYMAAADFESYSAADDRAAELYYNDPLRWQRMSLANIAGAGIFCADRAIHDYAREIWHLD